MSYNDISQSLIDHIVISQDWVDLVHSCKIIDDDCLNVSCHRPIIASINLRFTANETANLPFSPIKWSKVGDYCREKFADELNRSLSHIDIQKNSNIHDHIDNLYQQMVDCITYASRTHIPSTKYCSYLKPYWGIELKRLHNQMKDKRHNWVREGRPRSELADSFKQYKLAKRAFRRCHRTEDRKFMRKTFDDIDYAATINSPLFWKLLKAKSSRKASLAGGELIFNNKTYRDPNGITGAWGGYFAELYSDTEHEDYDPTFYNHATSFVQSIRSSITASEGVKPISKLEVDEGIKQLQLGKACGLDGVYAEHIKCGGPHLKSLLVSFFNLMYFNAHTSINLKRGVIITLFKGGQKKRTDPNSYRAITLSSSILKLYESVILCRLKQEMNLKIHPLQGGFQKGVGCIMTSYLTKECIDYCKENKSKLYSCFLDSRQAFDRV